MNINGKNGLACITPISEAIKNNKIELRPLPGLPVIRDLVVDMTEFYAQYDKIKPFFRMKLSLQFKKGFSHLRIETNLMGCMSAFYVLVAQLVAHLWWNPDKFVGPAALLQAYRFIADSRDTKTAERLEALSDPFSVYRCHGIMNCVNVCPKDLNPNKAIGEIKSMLLSGVKKKILLHQME